MGEFGLIRTAFLSKLEHQIERTQHLITLIPTDKLKWNPAPDALRLCEVLGHLLECMAGFCATLYAVDPARLAHFQRLREQRVNHCCEIDEARARIINYAEHIREGFALLDDADLGKRISTVFAPEGEAMMTILLGNLEHLINHKYQLFFYLKLLGVRVGTADLYMLR